MPINIYFPNTPAGIIAARIASDIRGARYIVATVRLLSHSDFPQQPQHRSIEIFVTALCFLFVFCRTYLRCDRVQYLCAQCINNIARANIIARSASAARVTRCSAVYDNVHPLLNKHIAIQTLIHMRKNMQIIAPRDGVDLRGGYIYWFGRAPSVAVELPR